MWGFPGSSAGKDSACKTGDLGSILGLGRSPGEGKGYPLQYPRLENSVDCIVHGVSKSRKWLSDFHLTTWLDLINSMYVSIPMSQFIAFPPFSLGIHIFDLYICVSISALQIRSSIPFFLDSTYTIFIFIKKYTNNKMLERMWEKTESFCTVGRNVNCYKHYGEQFGDSLKN